MCGVPHSEAEPLDAHHITDRDEFLPQALYLKIGSSFEDARLASGRLG
jgi:hypothetical protein